MEKIPKRFWEDDRWAEKHYSELQKKYKDKWVAVVNKKVVAVGDSIKKIREEARKKTGERHIPVLFVESGSPLY